GPPSGVLPPAARRVCGCQGLRRRPCCLAEGELRVGFGLLVDASGRGRIAQGSQKQVLSGSRVDRVVLIVISRADLADEADHISGRPTAGEPPPGRKDERRSHQDTKSVSVILVRFAAEAFEGSIIANRGGPQARHLPVSDYHRPALRRR